MFATRSGNVRRNSLADFENINRNGKIAMKLDEGDQHRRRRALRAERRRAADDGARPVHPLPPPTTCACSRAAIPTACAASGSTASDTVISMAILAHVEATPAERAAYLKQAAAMRRAHGRGCRERQ